jgi:1,4-alpha-glucan branching enzyme
VTTVGSRRRRRPGELALVLHTHVPWVAGHGTWPVGEEWLFQAWGTSWYPVTDLLWRLAEEGHRDVLTLGVTPMVAAQVADRRLRDDVGTWLAGQMWRAEEQRQAGWYLAPELTALGPFHWRHHADLLAIHEWVEAAGGLLPVWRRLVDEGVIEVLAGPASHPYLPLVGRPTGGRAGLPP